MKAKLLIGTLVLATAGAIGVAVYQRADREASPADAGRTAHARPQASVPGAKPKYLPQIEALTDPGLHWEERIKAVRELPARLGEASSDRLFAFLEEPPSTGEENWYLICNEIMEVLRKRGLVPEVFTRKHLALIESSKADPMIRDYATQHLAQWISGLDPKACESDPELASRAFDAMCAEAAKPANGQMTLVGTTLNALSDTVITGNVQMKAKREALGQVALKVLNTTDGTVSPVNRSTALQAATRLKVDGLSDVCRQIAGNKEEAVDVRLSSIAALGLVGEPGDVAVLQSFASDEAFKFAASAAIARLNARPSAP